jgi:hypothetical protein
MALVAHLIIQHRRLGPHPLLQLISPDFQPEFLHMSIFTRRTTCLSALLLALCFPCITQAQEAISELTVLDFESAKIGQPASEQGWTKRYGNGDPANWQIAKPDRTGNVSQAALKITGADVQALHPLNLAKPIAADTRQLHIKMQLLPTIHSGTAQPIRLGIASTDLKAISPFFGMTGHQSKEGGKWDQLRLFVGDMKSDQAITFNHWYELLLIVDVDPYHPSLCRASMYLKDMTAGEEKYTAVSGMTKVEFNLRKEGMPPFWGYFQLRGSYGGQVDNLSIGIGPGTTDIAQAIVPWTAAELPGGPVFAPITHQKDWKSERDLYGYNPAFIPNPVSFDQNNKPYIRQGYSFYSGKEYLTREPVAIQTLNPDGKWENIDFTAAIYKQKPFWDGKMHTGPFSNERITFDKDNGMYTLVDAQRSNIGRVYLCYRPKADSEWQLYDLPLGWTALEAYDGHNPINQPPAILSMSDKILRLIQPEKTEDGKLKLGEPIFITADSLLVPNHSGGANHCLTVKGKTYITWASSKPIEGQEGTPQYIVSYDHATGELSKPVMLGICGHGKPDNHNLPGLTIDSQGILHVVLGAHHDQFKYTHTNNPYDITSWTPVEAFGLPRDPTKWGSYTYVSLLCDADDTLHVVGRWAGAGYYFRLVYMRKKAGQDWEPHRYLMVPFRNMYSCWYHKMALDRKGRLFLSYIYYANQLSDAQLESYKAKWPDEIPTDVTQHAGNWRWGINPHDPGILVSPDKGDTWHLATTADFEQGVK